MYTLRIIDNQGTSNYALGKFYSTIDRVINLERFNELFKDVFNKKSDNEKGTTPSEEDEIVISFVLGDNDYIIPIYSTDNNYIMVECGKTFEHIKGGYQSQITTNNN